MEREADLRLLYYHKTTRPSPTFRLIGSWSLATDEAILLRYIIGHNVTDIPCKIYPPQPANIVLPKGCALGHP